MRKGNTTEMSNIDRLRNFNKDRETIESLMELFASALSIAEVYKNFDLKVPEWMIVAAKQVESEIKNRIQDTKISRLREASARLEALATPEEKRKKLAEEVAKLKTELGL